MAEPTGTYALPYPHERNDCDGCRERDADMRATYTDRRGNGGLQGRALLWCNACAGPALAQIVMSGNIATVLSREEFLGCENGCNPDEDGKACGLCRFGIASSNTPESECACVAPAPEAAVVAVTETRLTDGFCPHERACGCRARLRASAWACLDALVRNGWTVTPPAKEATVADDKGTSALWTEPILVRTLHPDDGYPCGITGHCDEPAEWSVELAGLDSRGEPPEDEAPHADACMAHLGWVAGALLPTVPSTPSAPEGGAS